MCRQLDPYISALLPGYTVLHQMYITNNVGGYENDVYYLLSPIYGKICYISAILHLFQAMAALHWLDSQFKVQPFLVLYHITCWCAMVLLK